MNGVKAVLWIVVGISNSESVVEQDDLVLLDLARTHPLVLL